MEGLCSYGPVTESARFSLHHKYPLMYVGLLDTAGLCEDDVNEKTGPNVGKDFCVDRVKGIVKIELKEDMSVMCAEVWQRPPVS